MSSRCPSSLLFLLPLLLLLLPVATLGSMGPDIGIVIENGEIGCRTNGTFYNFSPAADTPVQYFNCAVEFLYNAGNGTIGSSPSIGFDNEITEERYAFRQPEGSTYLFILELDYTDESLELREGSPEFGRNQTAMCSYDVMGDGEVVGAECLDVDDATNYYIRFGVPFLTEAGFCNFDSFNKIATETTLNPELNAGGSGFIAFSQCKVEFLLS